MTEVLPTMVLKTPTFIDHVCAKHSADWKVLEPGPEVDGEPMLDFVPFLHGDEGEVHGDVMRQRASEMCGGPAGQHHLERLLHCAQDIPEELQKFLLIFPDTLWELPDGTTRVPCLIYSYIGWILVSRLVGRDQFGQAKWGYNALVARVKPGLTKTEIAQILRIESIYQDYKSQIDALALEQDAIINEALKSTTGSKLPQGFTHDNPIRDGKILARAKKIGHFGMHNAKWLFQKAVSIRTEWRKFYRFPEKLWLHHDGILCASRLVLWMSGIRTILRGNFIPLFRVIRAMKTGLNQLGVKLKKPPDISGLEVFEIEVDGDDPRWQVIDRNKYRYCSNNASINDFHAKSGKRVVKYVLLPCPQEDSNQGVINDIACRNLTRPDRAITETILDARQSECVDKPIAGVCGAVRSFTHGHFVVGCVSEGADGRNLGLHDLQLYWGRRCQFVAVVSDKVHFSTIDSKSPPIFTHDKRNEGWKLLEEGCSVNGRTMVEIASFSSRVERYTHNKIMRAWAQEMGGRTGQHHAEWLLENGVYIPTEWRKFCLVFADTLWQDPSGQIYVPFLKWHFVFRKCRSRWTIYFWPINNNPGMINHLRIRIVRIPKVEKP